jgi:hypothetical protein
MDVRPSADQRAGERGKAVSFRGLVNRLLAVAIGFGSGHEKAAMHHDASPSLAFGLGPHDVKQTRGRAERTFL